MIFIKFGNSKFSYKYSLNVLFKLGTESCASGFIENPGGNRCFWFSDVRRYQNDSLSDCRSKTQNEGYLAEIRDSSTFDFLTSRVQSIFCSISNLCNFLVLGLRLTFGLLEEEKVRISVKDYLLNVQFRFFGI